MEKEEEDDRLKSMQRMVKSERQLRNHDTRANNSHYLALPVELPK